MTKTLVATPDPEDPEGAKYLEFLEEQFRRENGGLDLFADESQAHAEEIVKLYQVIADLREMVAMQRLLINILTEEDTPESNA